MAQSKQDREVSRQFARMLFEHLTSTDKQNPTLDGFMAQLCDGDLGRVAAEAHADELIVEQVFDGRAHLRAIAQNVIVGTMVTKLGKRVPEQVKAALQFSQEVLAGSSITGRRA